MARVNNTASGGIGFVGLLAIVFITLKLLKVIDWSWWWVLAPLWAPAFIVIVIFLIIIIGAVIYQIFKK